MRNPSTGPEFVDCSASSSQDIGGGDAVILHCKKALDNRYMSAFLTNRQNGKKRKA